MTILSDRVRRLDSTSADSARLVEHIFPRLREELLQLDRYLDAPPEAAHLKPVDQWTDAVVDRFLHGANYEGYPLPWPALRGLFGVRPAEVTLWAGPGGTGKSMLTSQIALALACRSQKICIASLEMPPVMTAYRLARQALGGEPPFSERIREILTSAGKFIWLYEQTGSAQWRRMLALARYCVAELGITQFVLDSVMKCGIPKDDYNSQIAFVDALCALAKDTGMHVHLISHTRKGRDGPKSDENQDVRGASEVTDLVDNVMMLARNRDKEREKQKAVPDSALILESDAMLTCSKQRHGEWQGALHLWYHPNAMSFLDHAQGLPAAAIFPAREPGGDDDF